MKKVKKDKKSLTEDQVTKVAELLSAVSEFAEKHGLVQKGKKPRSVSMLKLKYRLASQERRELANHASVAGRGSRDPATGRSFRRSHKRLRKKMKALRTALAAKGRKVVPHKKVNRRKAEEFLEAVQKFAEDHALIQKGGSKLPPHKNGRFDGYMGNKPRRPSNAKYMSDYRQGKKEWRTDLAKKKKRSLKRKHRGGGSPRKK